MSINRPTFVTVIQFYVMAKMKQTPHHSQPEPNPFLKKKPIMSTHIITTSNPASPDEPQPSIPPKEFVPEQPQQIDPEPAAQIVVIQPQPSSQEEEEVEVPPPKGVTPEEKREEPETSKKGRRKKTNEKVKKDKKPKKPKKIPGETTEGSPKTTSEALQQLKHVHKSQIQTQTASEAATSETPSEETPMTPDLSLPSFSSDLPKEWQELTEEEEEEEEEPQAVIKKQAQPHHQVITETTSDTGRTDRHTVAHKVPHKIFHLTVSAKSFCCLSGLVICFHCVIWVLHQ